LRQLFAASKGFFDDSLLENVTYLQSIFLFHKAFQYF